MAVFAKVFICEYLRCIVVFNSGGPCGMVVRVVDFRLTGHRFKSALHWKLAVLTFPLVVHDWVIKGLGMSIGVCAAGHIKDPVPLVEK